ncbi:MAG: hypothetical protein AB7P02_15465 [Alphaproteobacteria bacterium]
MDGTRFESALTDVSKEFENPTAILTAKDLTKEQRIELLQQWDHDLRLMLVASDENMASAEPGLTAEKLTEVRQALKTLGIEAAEAGAPTKTGGSPAKSGGN